MNVITAAPDEVAENEAVFHFADAEILVGCDDPDELTKMLLLAAAVDRLRGELLVALEECVDANHPTEETLLACVQARHARWAEDVATAA